MASHGSPPYLKALPPYLGGKRRLLRLIFGMLEQAMARDRRLPVKFVDPMSGGGAVALHAKALGFHVLASDIAARGGTVAKALIANNTSRLSKQDVLALFGNRGVPSTRCPRRSPMSSRPRRRAGSPARWRRQISVTSHGAASADCCS